MGKTYKEMGESKSSKVKKIKSRKKTKQKAYDKFEERIKEQEFL